MKIAFLSGRAKNGTLLPKSERFVWQELIRVMENDLKNPVFLENTTFLIPILNKFDLKALSIAERNRIPVEYYVPSATWGTEKLPQHQLYLINRMKGERHVFENSHQRIQAMIQAADLVYVLPYTDGVERFYPLLKNKPVRVFPQELMRYSTEEEGQQFHEQLRLTTALHMKMKMD